MKNAIFWDVTQLALVKTDVSVEFIASIITSRKIVFLRSVLRLLVTAKVAPGLPIIFTLIMEAIIFVRIVGSYKSHTA
jgi:hypothetical protein